MEVSEQYKREVNAINVDRSRVPTWASSLGARWRAVVLPIRQWRRHRARRRAFKGLLRLDEGMLADIGVTREELLVAEALPLSVNAAEELQRVSSLRRVKEKAGLIPR